MTSAWQCFHDATLELVRSTPIKQRLISAYRRNLALIPEDQLPAEIREAFGHIMRCMRGVQPLKGEDAVAASVRKMSMQEADDCAALIVETFGLLSRPAVTVSRPNNVVQLHDAPALTANS